MNSRFDVVNRLVEDAIQLPRAQQKGFVAARCGSDERLSASVHRLLALSNSIDDFQDAITDTDFHPGEVLGERFRITKELGVGAIGTVFLAHDRYLGDVALKLLHPELRSDPHAIDTLVTETRIGRSVRHANICPVFDLFVFHDARHDPIPAITMQYVHGETLTKRLARGALHTAEAMRIGKGIAAAIDSVHGAGFVHRDLKPDNIILHSAVDGAISPSIIDFGLARLSPECQTTLSDDAEATPVAGSPEYMAPEQFRTGTVSRAADVYAFGLILFEMIAGAHPFPPEDLLQAAIRRATEDAPALLSVAPFAARAWSSPIARALSRDPAKRPHCAMDVVEAIQRESTAENEKASRIHGCCRRACRVPIRSRRQFSRIVEA